MAGFVTGLDTSLLVNYYNSQLTQTRANATSAQSSMTAAAKKNSATAKDVTPWTQKNPTQEARDAAVMALAQFSSTSNSWKTSFMDTSKVPLSGGNSTDTKMEQDNQKLFALYNAVNNLSYLAVMAKRDGVTDAQRAGLNSRFQAGLTEIQKYISSASFNQFTVQAQTPSATVTSSAAVATASFDYTGTVLASGNTVNNALPGVSKSDSFTVTVTKGDTTTPVLIDLSKVQGDLTMGNIVSYVNDQLNAAGLATRFRKTLVAGTEDGTSTSKAAAQYSMQIVPGGVEQVSLSAAKTDAALYISGTTGLDKATSTQGVDSQGRLTKLSNLSDPSVDYAQTMSVSSSTGAGSSTAISTVVDSSGNVYMLGNAAGNIGNQLNQGSQDVYLTKYDSAGKPLWSELVGSAGTATAGSLTLNPKGGVVVVGSTTAQLTTTAISNGNQDSFAISYDANGSQKWTTQLPTLNANSANAVSVDSNGNVYIAGQTKGLIGLGQTNAGGQDAYVTKLDAQGKIVYRQQFGTSGSDSVAATAMTSSGDLLVASVQDGRAVVSKYTGGDATKPAAWTQDLGDLKGGSLGDLAVGSDGTIYVSGATRNTAMSATVAQASSGGADAFVMSLSDNGSSATANYVSYVGTSGDETGKGLAIGSDGSVYLTGSTNKTFAGQIRSQNDTNNMFVAKLDSSGHTAWTRQYGGLDGQSVGTDIAIDEDGSSVLDSLGLPTGKVTGQQNTDLTTATTLRAGDTFKVALEGTAARTFTVTIDKGETLNSLVTKINSQFGGKGKASIVYGKTGASLKLEVNSGVTAKLVAGPANFDALGRLGITPQTLSKPAASSSSSSSSTSSTSTSSYALGLVSNLSVGTTTSASAARAQLLSVLGNIQSIYQKSNQVSLPSSGPLGNQTAMSAAAAAYSAKVKTDASLALAILST
ncbi:hypothetical protein FHS83_001380 [Rhizomicrobium palustre]|uniref:Uncharacterized protein n=1 Tax=Rhizomicrobium palustre TaxID=189966 RepID=A0A846MYE2_9PROT|nr:hypothetical protein [Rhizomicrobium palustre]